LVLRMLLHAGDLISNRQVSDRQQNW